MWHSATRATGAARMLRDDEIDIRTVQLIGGWTPLGPMLEYLGIDRERFGPWDTGVIHKPAKQPTR